jgi:hypothetical protein
MGRIKVGHFEPDGSDVYIPVGFIPSYVRLVEMGATNPICYEWWSSQETDEASGSQEGMIDTGGTKTKAADAGGIVAYDTGTEGPTINDYTVARSTAATARTASAAGTFLRPSTTGTIKDGSAADRHLVFECVTAGTGSAEPTWPTAVGEQVTDGTTVFELVVEPTLRRGYQGFFVPTALMTDGQEMYYVALEADSDVDHGDVTSWGSGIED